MDRFCNLIHIIYYVNNLFDHKSNTFLKYYIANLNHPTNLQPIKLSSLKSLTHPSHHHQTPIARIKYFQPKQHASSVRTHNKQRLNFDYNRPKVHRTDVHHVGEMHFSSSLRTELARKEVAIYTYIYIEHTSRFRGKCLSITHRTSSASGDVCVWREELSVVKLRGRM